MSDTVSICEEWAYGLDGKSMYRSKVGAMDWSDWSEKERPFLTLPAVPPAMQRASSEAQFNVVGDELRKMNEKMDRLIERQGLMENAASQRYSAVVQQNYGIKGLSEGQQLIMQKLGAIEEYAHRGVERGERVALSLDRISKRLLSLELADRHARKRQPKPVRKTKR